MTTIEKKKIKICIELLKEDGKNTKESVAKILNLLVDNDNKKWGK